MAIVAGILNYGNLTTNELERDVLRRLDIRTLLKKNSPFGYMALNTANKKKSTQVKFEWALQDRTNIDRTTANGSHNSVVTTLNVDTGTATRFRAGHQLRVVRTGEIMLVDSDPSGVSALTVTRGFAGSTAASIVDNDPIHAMSPALGDAADSPTATFTQEGWLYNYCQIIAHSVQDTKRAMEARRYTGDTLNEQKDQVLEKAMREWDNQLFFGKPADASTASAGRRSVTGGIIHYLNADTTNEWNVAGQLTWSALKEKSYDFSYYGSETKTAFCGKTAFLALNNMAEDMQFRTTNDTVEGLGLRVTRMEFPTGGNLLLRVHPLWNEGADAQRIVVVDFDDITYRYFTGGKSFRWENIQQDDNPRVKKQELSMDAGLQYGDIRRHYHAYGITGYSAG